MMQGKKGATCLGDDNGVARVIRVGVCVSRDGAREAVTWILKSVCAGVAWSIRQLAVVTRWMKNSVKSIKANHA